MDRLTSQAALSEDDIASSLGNAPGCPATLENNRELGRENMEVFEL